MSALTQPAFSIGSQAFLRVACGALLLLTLLQSLLQARRFFLSERFGGYAKSDRAVDLIQNRPLLLPILAAWLGSGGLLVVGRYTVLAALVNLMLCRYYFVHMRWKGVLRGMGAPGFMTYWLAACVFFLEYGLRCDPTGAVRGAALTVFRLDFAVIMLCSGTYKALAGYRQNDGMELGMVNPWWGYWWRHYARLAPGHWLFRALNHLAWSTEVTAGLLMLIPGTQWLGAAIIAASFLFVATQIRLGWLGETVIACTVPFVPAGTPVDRWLSALVAVDAQPSLVAPGWLSAAIAALLWGYAVLLPLAKGGQYYNLLGKKRLPGWAQPLLDRYTNAFGIIIWRVFTADLTNFFARIYVEDPGAGTRTLYSRYGTLDWNSRFRFLHVGESICLASLFTTLKYYPGDSSLFEERLVRYSLTIPHSGGRRVVFEYLCILKDAGGFRFLPVVEFRVDPGAGIVQETVLEPTRSWHTRSRFSPLHAGGRPGSYAPADHTPG